jgi:hypothetical protein
MMDTDTNITAETKREYVIHSIRNYCLKNVIFDNRFLDQAL